MPLGVELDGVSLLGVSGLPVVVTVDVIISVVSVGPLTVQMYMQSTYIKILFHMCTTCCVYKLKIDSTYIPEGIRPLSVHAYVQYIC